MVEQPRLVTVFGGSGFIGTQLVQQLARRGHRIRVAVRRPDLAGHLRPLGAVGQIQPVQANLRDDASVAAAVAGADAVVNLAGIAFERGKQRFAAIHIEGAERVARAASAAGIGRLVQISALGADVRAPSHWAHSHALGEQQVLDAFAAAAILRAAPVFGTGDHLVSTLAGLARALPVFPLASGQARQQPVYVGDVAAAALHLVEDGEGASGVYELGGPTVLTLAELVERVLIETHRRRPVLPIPAGLARAVAVPLQFLPRPPLTPDQVRRFGCDAVVSALAERQGRTLAGLGVTPLSMDAVLPDYLWRFRPRGQFDRASA